MIAAGLSPDTLLSVLSDQFRNLLILRACGPSAADLLDIPADPKLAALAEKFDPAALSQNIAIIEELRRNMRANQTGRALLDATLVRLTLSGQFQSINQLLAGAPSELKKKPPQPVSADSSSPLPVYSRGEHSLSSSASFGTMGEGQTVEPAAPRHRKNPPHSPPPAYLTRGNRTQTPPPPSPPSSPSTTTTS